MSRGVRSSPKHSFTNLNVRSSDKSLICYWFVIGLYQMSGVFVSASQSTRCRHLLTNQRFVSTNVRSKSSLKICFAQEAMLGQIFKEDLLRTRSDVRPNIRFKSRKFHDINRDRFSVWMIQFNVNI